MEKGYQCPNCGSINNKGHRFCGTCGANLIAGQSQTMSEKPRTSFCLQCGQKIDYNAKFCGNCGMPFVQQTHQRMRSSPFYETNEYLLRQQVLYGYEGRNSERSRGKIITVAVIGIVGIVLIAGGVIYAMDIFPRESVSNTLPSQNTAKTKESALPGNDEDTTLGTSEAESTSTGPNKSDEDATTVSPEDDIYSQASDLSVSEIKNRAKPMIYDEIIQDTENYIGDIIYCRGSPFDLVELSQDSYAMLVATEEVDFFGYALSPIWVNCEGQVPLEMDIIDIWGGVAGLQKSLVRIKQQAVKA